MRRGLALLQVLTVGVLLNISALVACPMLQPEISEDSHACCPKPEPAKNRSSDRKCPIAPTMDTCPLDVTEAKFGTLRSKADVIDPPMQVDGVLFETLASEVVSQTWLRSPLEPSRIYLENRVLRI